MCTYEVSDCGHRRDFQVVENRSLQIFLATEQKHHN